MGDERQKGKKKRKKLWGVGFVKYTIRYSGVYSGDIPFAATNKEEFSFLTSRSYTGRQEEPKEKKIRKTFDKLRTMEFSLPEN
jgi:hypothetical protein